VSQDGPRDPRYRDRPGRANSTLPEDTSTTAIEALEKGLKDLQDLCDVVAVKYWNARDEFEEGKMAA